MSFTDIVRTAGNVQGTIGAVQNFAESILSMFGVDEVAIFDPNTFQQIFNTARPLKANIDRQLKLMDHPLENGAVVSDFAIVLPVTIEMAMIVGGDEYQSVYQQIKAYWLARQPVTVQTKADVFQNMLIQGIPHEETPDMMDVLPIAFKLREIQVITVQYQALPPQAVQAPADQSTVNRGAQQPQTSILYDISQYVKGIF
jgi:hypothetical protein